jgi:copper chaperone CopZ
VATQVFQVSGMTDRRCVRAISARVSDVPGVRTVEISLDIGTVRVTGTADPDEVRTAIHQAGYAATAVLP